LLDPTEDHARAAIRIRPLKPVRSSKPLPIHRLDGSSHIFAMEADSMFMFVHKDAASIQRPRKRDIEESVRIQRHVQRGIRQRKQQRLLTTVKTPVCDHITMGLLDSLSSSEDEAVMHVSHGSRNCQCPESSASDVSCLDNNDAARTLSPSRELLISLDQASEKAADLSDKHDVCLGDMFFPNATHHAVVVDDVVMQARNRFLRSVPQYMDGGEAISIRLCDLDC
jgi:hypothetical protein